MRFFIRIALLSRSNLQPLSAKIATSKNGFRNSNHSVSPTINEDNNPYEVAADNVANNYETFAENKNDINPHDEREALLEENSPNYEQDNPIHVYDYPPKENVAVT